MESSMKACEICGKRKQNGHSVSHSNIKNKRSFDVNLQNVRADIGGSVKTIRVCTSCIKANKVKKAI